ncbi:GTP-binding protein [Paenibacillus psychroresistens]|uniref:GTP-binding protein n=1 Tax=Paenibacillus psychroresistens TaxID=1778678 RepID=A0A6B8RKX4_9BACL|nr:GTP-binding protein [Paenibacillus psychroresistens]QGQ96404.1 GTP-binding protein [Paenibacillus psychroresistens]
MELIIPIHIISGFLGSGKTTLLKKALDYYKESGKKPAVIMNEIGDVNLDGLILGETVPMEEMLSGCICCTIRGDLGMTIQGLYQDHQPDVIFIESTGVANPMEIMDGVTEASLLMKIALKSIITLVDARHLLELSQKKSGKTFRLMRDQIRCANAIILNKMDQVSSGELQGLESIIREWNVFAAIYPTVYSEIDIQLFDELDDITWDRKQDQLHETEHEPHNHEHMHDHNDKKHHHSHDHVMVYTHYFERAIQSEAFDQLIKELPKEVYRAKGIMEFKDKESRFLFQYAYRQTELIKITPQGKVPNVAVFIGENFSKEAIKLALDKL